MEVTVSARHTEVSLGLRAAVEGKIGRLERFGEGLSRAEVHFFEEHNPRIADREVCEVTMTGSRHRLRCKASGPDGFVALDRAVAKLEHQLHTRKSKDQERFTGRRAARRLTPS